MSTIARPATFRPASFGLQQATRQVVSAAPFGGSEQAVDLLNDRWLASVDLPIMVRADAAAIEAFIASMRGQTNVVALYHFARPVPRGTMRASPTVSGAHSAGASILNITAGTANSTLLAGDMLGVGSLLLMVAADITLNGSGAGAVGITNRLRTALSGGAAITWSQPTALFRMLNAPAITYLPGIGSGVAIDFGEAI